MVDIRESIYIVSSLSHAGTVLSRFVLSLVKTPGCLTHSPQQPETLGGLQTDLVMHGVMAGCLLMEQQSLLQRGLPGMVRLILIAKAITR